MIHIKRFGLGLLFLVTIPLAYLTAFNLAIPQVASAADVSDIRLAQQDIYFCRERDSLAQDYSEAEVTKILEYCNNSNAAEIVEGCEDPRNLESNKYYLADSFLQDLCVQASGYNDEGVNVKGGNVVQANQELDKFKEAAGCYEYDSISSGIPRASICSLTIQQISELCRSGEILQPQYARSADICIDLSIDTPLDIVDQIDEVVAAAEGDAVTDDVGCDEQGGILGFIMCPLLWGLDTAINTLDSAVTSLLKVDYDRLTANGQLENAWAQFRNIAYILLIPTMLLMVIGTALGFQFLDAYTVKRALPRMLVAIIFIALSWEICRVMIEATNVVGDGIAGLIGAVVQPEDGTLAELQLRDLFTTPENVAATLGVTAGGSALLVGGVILAAIGGGVLLSVIGYVLLLLLSAFVALGIAFFLLALRQMLIIALIVIAPIAILAWIFPGNDKPWKFWWGSFSKLLLLFPIIILLLVTGRAFAYIIFTTGGVANQGIVSALVDFTLKLVAYIGPFFLIPATFKFAGGVFANLSGMVNDKSRGFFDRNRKRRAQLKGYAGKQIKEKASNGALFNPNSRLGRTVGDRFKGNKRAEDLTNLGKINSLKTMKTDLERARSIATPEHLEHAMEDKDMSLFNRDELAGVRLNLETGDKEGFTLNAAVQIRKRLIKERGLQNEKGEFIGTQDQLEQVASDAKAEASSIASRVFELQNRGQKETAYKEALSTWGVSDQDKDIAWSAIKRLQSKHSDHTLDQAFALKAMAGGTYFADDYSTWRAAGLATHGDSNAEGNMVVQGRKALMGAGRALEGGGGFGKTLTMLKKSASTTDEAKVAELSYDFKSHVKAQNGMSVLLHQSNKDGFTEENLIPFMQQELDRALAKDADGELLNPQEAIRVTAEVEFMHKQLGSTKPSFQKMFGEQVLGYSADEGRVLTIEEQRVIQQRQQDVIKIENEWRAEVQRRQEIIDDIRSGKMFDSRGNALPKFPTDTQGNLIIPAEYQPPPPPANLEQLKAKIPKTARMQIGELSPDPAYQNISYQFEVAERQFQQQMAAQQAAQAAATQQGGPGAPPISGGGPGAPPI